MSCFMLFSRDKKEAIARSYSIEEGQRWRKPANLNVYVQGCWVAQSVKRLTLGFVSGHDVTVRDFESRVRLCTNSTEPTSDPLSPFCPPLLMLARSLS